MPARAQERRAQRPARAPRGALLTVQLWRRRLAWHPWGGSI